MSDYARTMFLRLDVGDHVEVGVRHPIKIAHEEPEAAAYGARHVFSVRGVLVSTEDFEAGTRLVSVGAGDKTFEYEPSWLSFRDRHFVRMTVVSTEWHEYGSDLWVELKSELRSKAKPKVYVEFETRPKRPTRWKQTAGSVTVEWVDDPGKKVSGQWRVSTPFWEAYPSDAELRDVVRAAQKAIAERDVACAWFSPLSLTCLRCGEHADSAWLHDCCPSCGFRIAPSEEVH